MQPKSSTQGTLIMKNLSLLTAGLALSCLSLTQCVVAPAPAPAHAYGYGGGYGATGRVATNAMWAGVTAYGIHERNETRREISDNRTNRVNHAVNNYHKPPGGGRHGGRPPKGGGGGRHR